MRVASTFCVFWLFVLGTGCGPRQEAATPRGPLFSGKLEGGSHWKNPVGSSSNEGGEIEKGSRVEVYDQFIIVTAPSGLSRVLPHGYYSDLVIRKE
jgi:hypothetical protein